MFWNDFFNIYWSVIVLSIILITAIVTFLYCKSFENIPRGLKLLSVVFFEITLLCFFWNEIENFITTNDRAEWLKGLLPIVMAAIPAYFLWHWRDTNRRQELKHQAAELKLKENNDAWENFIKYQKIAEDRKHEHSDATRAAAIFALGEYYGMGSQFPQQTHVFFKKFLDIFWDKQKIYHEYLELFEAYDNALNRYNEKGEKKRVSANSKDYKNKKNQLLTNVKKLEKIDIPEYIKAVHEVIFLKSNLVTSNKKNIFHYINGLSFLNFNFIRADLSRANLFGAEIRKANFTCAKLDEANLCTVESDGAHFICAKLNRTNFIYSEINYVNFTGADLHAANLFCAEMDGTNFTDCSLGHANLVGTRSLWDCSFAGATFEDANLTCARHNMTNFTGADFNYANLSNVKLRGANLCGAELSYYDQRGKFYILLIKLKITYFKRHKLDWLFSKYEYNLFSAIKFVFRDWKLEPDFTGAICDIKTQMPDDFDKEKAGMTLVKKIKKKAKNRENNVHKKEKKNTKK